MNKKTLNIVAFGEVLYDVFLTHRKIGGAPLNVASRLTSLGINAQIISRIGKDEIGKELLEYIQANNIPTDTIQIDETYSTGEVLVQLDKKGSASYTINYPVAWDKIEITTEAKNCVENADALVFGSLACRDDRSYNSLLSLIQSAKYKIFDVNLRAPFYAKELLINQMKQSDFIKFNDDELYEISEYLNSPFHSMEQNILFIAEQTNAKSICVTKGSHGAVLYTHGKMYYNSGYKINVADTVGAGDSFLAGLLSKLFVNKEPQKAIDFACALGALVASNEGANPKITNEVITNFMNNKVIL
ncbi:carbohydrate kinase family protein [Flavobacterium gawalongense]|uniref:Carbohydrate kinase n=1 Tax=Flavobacterium gawalongense TaxID=2594432 RepID=A0A553BB03_9FLAO|nr:carbohydrate kinase [Flavobacterium gawalongense]TRX05428.1 carbohydrate kinase [Flavobacterium gawalongense]TRX06223.1 carbohydrate kinase [Flavobacterium gawalongense]TRX21918.1 carbohydrate kinase [Flavobacterium gawalongense]